MNKKSKYPTTYEECFEVMYGKQSPYSSPIIVTNIGYKGELIKNIQRLLFYRDAYWKIAGEEMGFGKPWKPDWGKPYEGKFVIDCQLNEISKGIINITTKVLAFPTEEMRDAFYEAFKDLINEVKELL